MALMHDQLSKNKRTAICLLVAGGIVALAILPSEFLLLPPWLEELGRLIYRPAFLIVLPLHALLGTLIEPTYPNDHSLVYWLLVCLATPCFYWGMWRLWLISQHQRQAKSARMSMDRSIETAETARLDQSATRRTFLLRAGAGALAVAAGGVGLEGLLLEPRRLRLRTYEVPIKDLPLGLDGLRLVHLSDTHYGPFVSMEYLHRTFTLANSLRPDLVVLTGDYVHLSPHTIEPGIRALTLLQARYGAVAVLGNHEHREGAEACRSVFHQVGIPLLDNKRLYLDQQGLSATLRDRQSLCIAGLDDLWEDNVDFTKALGGVPPEMACLLLEHNPDVAEMIGPKRRVDLMLCGHTHGGQILLPLLGTPLQLSAFGTKYLGGICQGPRCPVIVSRGVGLTGLPLRLGVPPEIGLITLRCG